jgi:hypothetical protein
MEKERRKDIWKLGILLFVAMCAVSIAPAATAQETPFVIYGYVFNANGTECDNPNVNITNMDTGSSKAAENTSGSNCYLLVLATGTDLNTSETLRTEVTSPDGSQSKIVECTVTESDVENGGEFEYNITLSVPNQQTWYFTNDSATGPTWSGATYNRNMTKGVEGEDEKITLAPGDRVWFYAGQLAECNVSFSAGAWNVSYWVKTLDATESGTTLYTILQNITSGGNSTVTGNEKAISYSGNIQENVESLDAGIFTVPKDGRFAIEVFWPTGAAGGLEVYCNPQGKHSSHVTSPSSDPGYPIPELPTVILLGVGLLVITGYVVLRRNRRE